ncbi:hypothetical protein Cs7R123_45400 [Catellatospora sp. TT07R-123]|nr:hypothetical protein Cs7R123_45400 [Catellatospora sp. TT07R-123]
MYALLLGFTLTLPFATTFGGAKVETVTVADPAACHGAIGFAPFAGFPQRCDVTWTTEDGKTTGTLYGQAVDGLTKGTRPPTSAVHQLGNYAFTAPIGNGQLMMACLAPPILFIGLHALSRRRRRRHHHGGGFDLDLDGDDDDDSDDGGDGGDD